MSVNIVACGNELLLLFSNYQADYYGGATSTLIYDPLQNTFTGISLHLS